MSHLTINAIRNRTWHSLSPYTAAQAGLTVANLQQFIAGTFTPPEEALIRLANYYQIKV